MSNFTPVDWSSLITYNSSSKGFNSIPDYSITASKTTVNEGEALTYTIRAWGWPDGSNVLGGGGGGNISQHRIISSQTEFLNGTCSGTITVTDDKLINASVQTYELGFGIEDSEGYMLLDGVAGNTITVTDTSQYAAITANPTNAGLTYEVGMGYWNGNFNFSFNEPYEPISNFATGFATVTGYTALSVKIAGYFKAPSTGNHTISFTMTGTSSSKMQMYMWLGENALSPSLSNRVGAFSSTVSFTATMTANQLLPILVIAGAPTGLNPGDSLMITGPDLTGKVFHL